MRAIWVRLEVATSAPEEREAVLQLPEHAPEDLRRLRGTYYLNGGSKFRAFHASLVVKLAFVATRVYPMILCSIRSYETSCITRWPYLHIYTV